MASNWAVRLDSLSDRLTRGIGPMLIAVDERDLGGGIEWPVKSANQLQAGLLVEVGLRLADHRLAEQVGREREPAACGGPSRCRLASSGVAPAMNFRAITPGRRPGRRRQPFGPLRTGGRQP